jgi:hypothetical protein
MAVTRVWIDAVMWGVPVAFTGEWIEADEQTAWHWDERLRPGLRYGGLAKCFCLAVPRLAERRAQWSVNGHAEPKTLDDRRHSRRPSRHLSACPPCQNW